MTMIQFFASLTLACQAAHRCQKRSERDNSHVSKEQPKPGYYHYYATKLVDVLLNNLKKVSGVGDGHLTQTRPALTRCLQTKALAVEEAPGRGTYLLLLQVNGARLNDLHDDLFSTSN